MVREIALGEIRISGINSMLCKPCESPIVQYMHKHDHGLSAPRNMNLFRPTHATIIMQKFECIFLAYTRSMAYVILLLQT